MSAALSEIGYAGALLARRGDDGKLILIDGHLRAETTPEQEVPVLVLDLTEAEALKLLACYDPISAMADVDEGALRLLVEEVKFDTSSLADAILGAYDLSPALDEQEVDAPARLDEAEQLREKWGVEPGQVWRLGVHRLMCGDSTSAEDVARLMAGERSALMNTDPPYGVDYGGLVASRAAAGGSSKTYDPIENDELDGAALQVFLEAVIRTAVAGALSEKPAFYLWHPMLTQGTFFAAAAAAAADILIHRQIVWVKPSLILGRGDFHWRHELCFYGWIRGRRCAWLGDRAQTTVWEVGRESDGLHPTQKPVELFERPLRYHTQLGDVCYEPFSGSGSQLIAAERTGRRCFAMELAPKYVAVGIQRWVDATGGKPVLLEPAP